MTEYQLRNLANGPVMGPNTSHNLIKNFIYRIFINLFSGFR